MADVTRFAHSSDCPFELNRERFENGGRDSHWDGGFYFEVWVGGRERDMESEAMEHFWMSDRRVVHVQSRSETDVGTLRRDVRDIV